MLTTATAARLRRHAHLPRAPGRRSSGGPTSAARGAVVTRQRHRRRKRHALRGHQRARGSTMAAAEYFVDTGTTATPMARYRRAFGWPQRVGERHVAGRSAGDRQPHHLRPRPGRSRQLGCQSAPPSSASTRPARPPRSGAPNPEHTGTIDVALAATASDAATGGIDIGAAEYFLDAQGTVGSGTGMPCRRHRRRASRATIPAATVAALRRATIPSVRAQDALGNWGASATITLTVVDRRARRGFRGGASPTPTTAPGVNSSTPAGPGARHRHDALRRTVAAPRASSTLTGATARASRSSPPTASSNGATENGYADIPLTTINRYCRATTPSTSTAGTRSATGARRPRPRFSSTRPHRRSRVSRSRRARPSSESSDPDRERRDRPGHGPACEG